MTDETRPDRTELPLDVLDRIDRVCDRFEATWERGECPRIEDALGEVAEPHRRALLRDLLAAEVAARRRRGEWPEPRDYQGRFPGDLAAVDAAFGARPRGPDPSEAATRARASLLIGLLGFQTGLIDQTALIEALRDWTTHRTRPLAEILEARGALDGSRRALLEDLAAECLEQHGGDLARSLASLPAGDSTRKRLARLADPEIDATLTQIGTGPIEPGAAEFHLADGYSIGTAGDGQRFRVLRPHAKGGLGAVFVALDTEVHREVALKQILERHADDPVSRSRFLAEAEITGGLEHPGIVPVYGLGTYADGRPYYAMRFIAGDSLKEAIDQFHADESLKSDPGRRSLELRKLLRRFTDVCNAIDYAHSRGVLHRDIKPGNIIVGRHGETLVVDWGLAKAVGHEGAGAPAAESPLTLQTSDGRVETQPGSALGTPAFMSPEQAAGELDRLGPRSDVYSLGATLYCLLAGRPPFLSDDIGELIRAVRDGRFPPPRAIDPSVDPALDAICKKAMSLRPEDRHESARALADDLERWMADEPVLAYRDPLSARLGRWARRHKPVVTGAAALLITTVVALTVSTYLIGREQEQTRAAYLAEAAQRRRADARSRLARRAVDDMYTQVAERWLADQPRMEPVQREFLEKARAIYEELAGEDDSDPAVRRETGSAHRRVGDIQARLGRQDLAERDYLRARGLAEELAARFPADPNYRLDAASAIERLAEVMIKTGRLPEAERALDRAIEILSDLDRDGLARPESRRALATGYDRRGYLMRLTGRWPGAEQAFRRAVTLLDTMEQGEDPTPETRRARAAALHNFGHALHRVGRVEESIQNFRQAVAAHERLIAERPGSPADRTSLAGTLLSLGFARTDRGQTVEAERDIRRAIDLFRRLADDFPSVPDYRKQLESAYNTLANLLRGTDRRAETKEAYRRAVELAEALDTQSPGIPAIRADLIRNLGNFGNFLQDVGQPGD
jgi:serine/threonine-protein kinase